MLKRFIDILLSLIGILLALPFFSFIALLIKLESKGPVFYLGERVGKDGKTFKMYKLRTMYHLPVSIGASVCPAGDPRVTPMGRLLRRTKLNEVPQLLNVLKGDMTLVGPRQNLRTWLRSTRHMPRKSSPSNRGSSVPTRFSEGMRKSGIPQGLSRSSTTLKRSYQRSSPSTLSIYARPQPSTICATSCWGQRRRSSRR